MSNRRGWRPGIPPAGEPMELWSEGPLTALMRIVYGEDCLLSRPECPQRLHSYDECDRIRRSAVPAVRADSPKAARGSASARPLCRPTTAKTKKEAKWPRTKKGST